MDIRTPIPSNGGDWLPKFGETWKTQTAQLKQKFADGIEEVRMLPEYPTDVPIVYVKKAVIVQVLTYLKTEPGFEYGFLSDLTAIDD